jgi:16S rRNA (guanine(527)-N(7))-methyltransferase RsmG
MTPKGIHSRLERPTPSPAGIAALMERCGIFLSATQIEQLWTYHQLLRQYNTELNLTRIHNFDNMVIKLYADSILPGKLTDLPSPLLDLGTGAGMPGIPLKIAYPHLEIHLAESRQNRVAFLKTAVEHLNLERVRVIGRGISAEYEQPVAGVITRAVEAIHVTLDRVRGSLASGGMVIFMKGPHCEEEIESGVERFSGAYRLLRDLPYRIPDTTHERRLVIFQRLDQPLWAGKANAMKRHPWRKVESEQNEVYKDLKKLLSSRGIKKQGRALVSGRKQIMEILKLLPERCEAWVDLEDRNPPPPDSPPRLMWYQLAPSLHDALDVFGTQAPLLLIRTQAFPEWNPRDGLSDGCTVFIPFQDPENVGAAIRSSVAFGAHRMVLLAESAHPYHPKALRTSGGAVLHANLLHGPSLQELDESLRIVPLSMDGRDISNFTFPASFGLLPGMEGPGLPDRWRQNAVSIPIHPEVESLNGAAALAIALYLWSQTARGK